MAETITVGDKRTRQGLDPAEQTLMERILLELYCQYEPSLHFREIVSHDVSSNIFIIDVIQLSVILFREICVIYLFITISIRRNV